MKSSSRNRLKHVAPSIPGNEEERLAALRRYNILDTPKEKEFDEIALIASQICQTPIALISLIDENRQWFKAKVGYTRNATPRDISFCGHAICEPHKLTIIPDARRDLRFAGNPLVTGVPHIRFYAGTPLVTQDGYALGTVCVIDHKPRKLTPDQTRALWALSRQVVAQIELRRLKANLESEVQKRTDELARANEALHAEIAERTIAQQELWQREERFRLLIENASDVVTILDAQGTMRYESPSAERVLGYKPAELVGKNVLDFIHPDDASNVMKTLAHGVTIPNFTITIECRFRHKDGSWRVLEALGRNLLHDPILAGVVVNSRDITERKQSEDQIQRQALELREQNIQLERANKVKDEFLSVMSHELRTPLTAVTGYVGLMREGMLGDLNEKQLEACGKVIRRSKDLLSIVNSILFTTSLESEALKAESDDVNLGALMTNLKSTCEASLEKPLTLTWEFPPDLPAIRTDGAKLKHVLENLINNAIKFTDKGEVKISARLIERSASGSRPIQNSERRVEFRVADTGIGIPKEMQSFIFEKFKQVDSSETRLYGGVGLGLYIAKQFTEMLGGSIEVESEPGRGSTFKVLIPYDAGDRGEFGARGRT